MKAGRYVLLGLAALLFVVPSLGQPPSLQAQLAGWSGSSVSVAVYNPSSSSVAARIQLTVLLDPTNSVSIQSNTFTVPAGQTRIIGLTAPGLIYEIGDGPDPIPPTES